MNIPPVIFRFRALVALAIILGGGLAATLILRPELFASRDSYGDYADDVIRRCKDEPYRPACYDKEIPKLMDVLTMEEAFEVAQAVIEKDQSYLHCHVLGHYLAGREVEKNPAARKDVIARCPATICNNGCLHGPLLKRFNKEVLDETELAALLPDLQDVCEPRESSSKSITASRLRSVTIPTASSRTVPVVPGR